MRITCLNIQGKRATQVQTEAIGRQIVKNMAKQGFITEWSLLSRTGLKIGLHMQCFRVDTGMVGYNVRPVRFGNPVVPYKRTSVPTWDQRVRFNDTINEMLDKIGATARIVSGAFVVRSVKEGAFCERDWMGMAPNDLDPYEIEPMTKDMEERAAEARRLHRIEQRRPKTIKLYSDNHNGTAMSKSQYHEERLQMSTGDFHTHKVIRLQLVKV